MVSIQESVKIMRIWAISSSPEEVERLYRHILLNPNTITDLWVHVD